MPDYAGYVRRYPQFNFWDKVPREYDVQAESSRPAWDSSHAAELDRPEARRLHVSPLDPGTTTEELRAALRSAMERSGVDPNALVSVDEISPRERFTHIVMRSFDDTNTVMRLRERPALDGRPLLLQRPHSFRPPVGARVIMNNAVTAVLDAGEGSEAPRLLFRVRPELTVDAIRALASRFGQLAQVTVARRRADIAVAVVDYVSVTQRPEEVGRLLLGELSRLSPGCSMRQQRRQAQLRSSGSEALTPVPAWIVRNVADYAARIGATARDASGLLDPGPDFEQALSSRVRIFGLVEPADMLDYSEPLAAGVADQARRLLLRFLACCERARPFFPPELVELSGRPQDRASVDSPLLKTLISDSAVELDMVHLSVDIAVGALSGYERADRIAAWGLFCLFPTKLFRGQHLITQFVVPCEGLQLPSGLITADDAAQEPGEARKAAQGEDDDLMNELFEEIQI